MTDRTTLKFDGVATAGILVTLGGFSLGPILVRYFTNYVDAWSQNCYRYSIACLFWMPYLVLSVRTNRIDNRIWRRAVWPSLINIAMQTVFAIGFYYIKPTFLILLSKSSILWVAGFSLLFFADERPLARDRKFWLGLILSIIGLVGVVVYKEGFDPSTTIIGIVMALAAGISQAFYFIAARVAFRNMDSRVSFAVIALHTSLGLAVLAVLFGEPAQGLTLSGRLWGLIVISGIIPIAIAHTTIYAAMRRVGATIPSIALLVQPFVVLAMSRVLFDESLSVGQWLSGLILMVGAALAIYAHNRIGRERQIKPQMTN